MFNWSVINDCVNGGQGYELEGGEGGLDESYVYMYLPCEA